jgi:hypothetical protein
MKLLITIILALAYSSCTLSVSPDGTRTYGVDANTAIEILNNK